MVCSKYVIVNILHKGDNKEEDNNNNNNNSNNTDDDNNNNVMLCRGDVIFCIFSTRDSGTPLCETNPPSPPPPPP